jgi:putative spermidine/putrescine transport system ATP-binding protein
VFHRGRIRQLDTPRAIHEEPANGFVAQFVGETNSAQGVVAAVGSADVRLLLDGGIAVVGVSRAPTRVGDRKLMTVRPERVRIDPPAGFENAFAAVVEETTYLGDRLVAILRLSSGMPVNVDLGIDGLDHIPLRGQSVKVGWPARHCLVLDPE